MELVERYLGFDICRTSAGHLVVVDPRDGPEVREELFTMLVEAGALDALFHPNLLDARAAVREMLDAERRRD